MADSEFTRGDRASIDDAVIQIYKTLTEDADVEMSPFKTYKDVFMFATCLGYSKHDRRLLSSGKKHTIRREVFTEDDVALLKAIAIATTNDVAVLSNIGDILTIAEEYAHAGIYDLESYLLDQGGRPLWNLVELLKS